MREWDLDFTSCDFETPLIRPALQAPPPVCMSWADKVWGGRICATADVDDTFRKLITDAADGKTTIVGHNFAYDACCAIAWIDDVLEPLFAAYERGTIIDTGIFERIAEIGKFTTRKVLSLEVIGAAYGIAVTKDANVRLGYGPLYGAPLSEYTKAQREYPIEDAENTLTLIERQIKRHGLNVHAADVAFLCRKQLWLQLTRNWGLRTDPKKLGQLRRECAAHVAELRQLAQETTIDLEVLKGKDKGQIKSFPLLRADGTRDMRAIKAYVLQAYDGQPPTTDTGERKIKDEELDYEGAIAAGYISTAAVTLQESGDFILEKFAEFGEWSAVENKDLPMLEAGTIWPIHTKYGIADTTRSTSAKPNVQNFRRKEGIRECVIARPGCALISVDHGGLELCTLAQVIINVLGTRIMADKINAGMDLHCDIAKEMLLVSYETALQWYKDEDCPEHDDAVDKRQCGKVVNFGRPGFMGAETLVHYAKHSYKVDFAEIAPADFGPTAAVRALNFAKQLIAHWERANPEGAEYLRYAKRLPQAAGGRVVTIPGTTILRRGATVSAAANTGFQGLGAVLEAFVGWIIAKEIYLGSGPLRKSGARIVNFVHDEFICEVPLRWVTECANQLESIMATAPRKYLPDVRIGSDAKAMLRWSKKAKRIVKDGELIPWDEAA